MDRVGAAASLIANATEVKCTWKLHEVPYFCFAKWSMVEWSATASQGPSVLMAPKPEREVKATEVLRSAYAVALAVRKLSLPFCEGEEGCLVPFFGCVIFWLLTFTGGAW